LDPEIRDFGGLLLTWHGVFTAVGIAAGVWLAVWLGKRRGFLEDDIYSAALIAIPFGIIGARALFVAERWNTPGLEDWYDVFRLNEGGISIYGAMLGGLLGGLIYGGFRRLPVLRALDIAIVALLLGMAIGRVGDVINGEHFAEPSSLPWAVRYTNLNSPSVLAHPECGLDPARSLSPDDLCAQHPAVAYEMLADLLIVGVGLLIIRFAKRDGVAFFACLLLYSLMRFGVSELRLDSREVIWGLTTPQVTSLFLIPFSAVGLVWTWFRGESKEPEPATPVPPAAAPRPATR
jgi:phosphatidylglycerol:prolipoprotein diacylglycerol transferase